MHLFLHFPRKGATGPAPALPRDQFPVLGAFSAFLFCSPRSFLFSLNLMAPWLPAPLNLVFSEPMTVGRSFWPRLLSAEAVPSLGWKNTCADWRLPGLHVASEKNMSQKLCCVHRSCDLFSAQFCRPWQSSPVSDPPYALCFLTPICHLSCF